VELVIERKGKRSLKSFACWNWRRKVRALWKALFSLKMEFFFETIG
jgi:hypothetical protein